MANSQSRASLIVELRDLASRGALGIRQAFSSIRDNFVAIGLSFGSVVAFVNATLRAFSEQEAAVSKLNTALKNQGIFTAELSQDLQDFASSLQKTTTFSDETIVEMQALLTTFGLAGEPLKATTRAALDLASGLGIDLRTATMLLGKAAIGETATLARYGITIKDSVPVAERFSAVLQQVNARFGGSAAAQAQTFLGRVEQIKNLIGEIAESIGKTLEPHAIKVIKWMNYGADAVARLARAIYEELGLHRRGMSAQHAALDLLVRQRAALRATVEEYKRNNMARGDDYNQMAEQIRVKTDLINKLREEIALEEEVRRKNRPAAENRIPEVLDEAAERERIRLADQANERIKSLTPTREQVDIAEDAHLARMLQKYGLHEKARELVQARGAQMRQQIQANLMNTLATIGSAKSKELFLATRAVAAAQATIHAFAAYNYALMNPPGPPFSIPQAKIALGLGLSNVALIAAQSFAGLAEGGMVLPSQGGSVFRFAEAGKPEVAIPLDDDRTKEKLAEVFRPRGEPLHINVHCGVVFANEATATKLAEIIDQELWRLGRSYRG